MKKKDDKLRETILSAARDLASQQGIDSLNIRLIAKQAGVASGTVYNYFSNKDEILLALTKEYWRQALLELEAAITADSFCEGLSQILSFLKEQIRQSAGQLMHSLGGVQRAGKESMAYAQLGLDALLIRLLEQDPAIRSEIWGKDFTREQFVKFIRRNLTGLLTENEEDAVFLSGWLEISSIKIENQEGLYMAQAIAETVFDILYLGFALTAGILMLWKGKTPLDKKMGGMAALLGAGDAFHLIPRCYALFTTGLEANAAALGIGKFVTSITMTIFYLILYAVWREYYKVKGRGGLTAAMLILAALRIGFCLLAQNEWLAYRQPLAYGILRNVPFAVMGILIIVIFAQETRKSGDPAFQKMPLAVALSFGFYLPVVLFSGVMPVIGMLMIPKTLAYVWVIWMEWQVFSAARA